MLRRQLLDHRTQDADPNAFRWRGTDVSRLEGFTDAILGFAITLVVVSLDVPDTLDGLLRAMRGFVPFGPLHSNSTRSSALILSRPSRDRPSG